VKLLSNSGEKRTAGARVETLVLLDGAGVEPTIDTGQRVVVRKRVAIIRLVVFMLIPLYGQSLRNTKLVKYTIGLREMQGVALSRSI